jgi:CxxC-x17-CxxC domain-containing protein
MANFRSDRPDRFRNRSSGNSFGRRSYGNSDRGNRRGGFGGRNSRTGPTEMHEVTCDKCGKQCEVPFKPTGDKPVFCSDCFRKNEGSSNSFGPRNQDNRQAPQSAMSLEQFNQINAKLDKIIQALEVNAEED